VAGKITGVRFGHHNSLSTSLTDFKSALTNVMITLIVLEPVFFPGQFEVVLWSVRDLPVPNVIVSPAQDEVYEEVLLGFILITKPTVFEKDFEIEPAKDGVEPTKKTY
jgi:hypothetical protein